MKILIFIIAVAILLWLKLVIFKRIDADEAKSLATPGRANFIRDNYEDVIDYLLSIPNSRILFERTDQVQIGFNGDKEYIAINSYCGGLLIAYVKWSVVQQELKFARNESSKHIIYTLHKYFN